MSPCQCGNTTAIASQGIVDPAAPAPTVLPPWGFVRRGWHLAQWLAPVVTLTLMPKCPVCVATYVALATGVGISIPAAGQLRVVLMVLCVGALGFLALRAFRKLIDRDAGMSGPILPPG